MAKTWKRPESIPYPKTWDVFEGRKPLPNGQIPRFRIQDLTDDLAGETIKQMQTIFLADEPCCSNLGMDIDKEASDEMGVLWTQVISYRIGLVAVLDNAEELEDKTLPRVAGCNMTYPIFPGKKDHGMKNKKLIKVIDLMDFVSDRVDCFAKYNTSVIMYALGLSVDRIFRGQGIGERLLKARFPLGRALGIPVTTTVFTGAAAMVAAAKAGFETLVEVKPEEFKQDGVEVFKGINCKTIKLMAAIIE